MGIFKWLSGLFRKKIPEASLPEALLPAEEKKVEARSIEKPEAQPEIRRPMRPVRLAADIEFIEKLGAPPPPRAPHRRAIREFTGPGMKRLSNRSRRLRVYQGKAGFDSRKKMVDLEEE